MTVSQLSSQSGAATTSAVLAERYQKIKSDNAKLRIRDAAQQLGVSEAELVACDLAPGSHALTGDPRAILKALPAAGSVMCLTRNDCAVHERYGAFEEVRVEGPVGLVLGEDIDLRLFFREWHSAFYLVQKLASGTRESFQFFDRDGNAILKIYATGETDLSVFRRTGSTCRQADASARPQLVPGRTLPKPGANHFDKKALRRAWSELKDTHDFHSLLKTFDADRISALRAVGAPYAEELPLRSVSQLMEPACAKSLPIMVFVNNPGCIQIHTGAVNHFKTLGQWLNILDPTFNLHADSSQFSSCWRVRKPSVDGIVTSLEVMDREQNLCLQFFGARKPGMRERHDWSQLVDSLPSIPVSEENEA